MLRPFTMYDSVNVELIPEDAKAVAGYVNGQWKTYPKLIVKFPKAAKLSIAVSTNAIARCLDVESQDATNEQAAAWVRAAHERGVKRPIVYSSVSNWPALEQQMKADGMPRGWPGRRNYRRWTAHYTGVQHRCTRKCDPGFRGKAAATQYTNHALGRNLDASWCSAGFLR